MFLAQAYKTLLHLYTSQAYCLMFLALTLDTLEYEAAISRLRTGVTSLTAEQEAMLYDKGRITPENKMNISVRDIPASYLEQTPQPQDGQFGFVNQDVFGRPQRVKDELMKGQELGYQYSPFFSGQQYQEERISVADKLGLPETAGPEVWTAALNSDVTKNTYTVAGQAIRSVTAGVLGDLLFNTFL